MSKAERARKLARTLPRDAKGKFLPRGSKNLFRKTIKSSKTKATNSNSKTHRRTTKRKRSGTKRKTSHGSHLNAGSVLELLDPLKDVISLLSPLLGGSHTKAHAKRQKQFQTLITGKPEPKKTMKRRRNNNNNGRKDVFPNFLTGALRQTVTDTFVTNQVNTPIPRIQTTRSGQKATVMELLWIEMLFPTIEIAAPLANLTAQFVIGIVPNVILPFNNPRVFAEKRLDTHATVEGASGKSGFKTEQPFRYEMESTDGHGFLLAAESFHVGLFSANTTPNLNAVEWRMYYRFIDIPLSEFIGLVQSTQQ